MTSKSYTSGTGKKSLWHITLPDLLDQRAKEYPDKDVHVFWTVQNEGDLLRESISYQDLAERSYNVAASLLDLGLEPGDRIAIAADNCPEWLLMEYAALRCKLLLIRLPPADATAKVMMDYIVQHECKAIVVDGRQSDKVTRLASNMFLKKEEECTCEDSDDSDDETMGSRVLGLKDEPGSRLLTVKDLADPETELNKVKDIQDSINPDDVAVVLTTSGSSGTPKLVELSHFAVINNSRCAESEIIPDDNAVYYNSCPFFWIGSHMYDSLSLGITMVHMEKAAQENLTYISAVLSAEKVTVGKFMPNFLQKVYKKSTRKGKVIFPSTLQYIITGGAGLDEEVVIYYQRQFRGVLQDYGTTETMSVATNMRTCHDTGTEFKAVANVEMKIVNVNGVVLPAGQPGLLLVKSPFTFKGYLDQSEESTREEIDQREEKCCSEAAQYEKNGWYNTHDIAMMSEEGGVVIIGRCRDVIRNGSLKIYPAMLEKTLKTIPTIDDVVVVGVPEHTVQQEICACVIVAPGSHETVEGLQTSCDTMRSTGVIDCTIKHLVIMKRFPAVPDGKIDKIEIMEMLRVRYNIE